MIENKFVVYENLTLSREDFEKVYGRKPEKLNLTQKIKERDYHEYARSEEAFFGESNAYKTTVIALFAELREAYQNAISKKNSKAERRNFSKDIEPIIKKFEKHIEKTFNIKKCYFGLIDDLNAWCIPLCFDSNLVTKKDGKTVVNKKVKVSLEDIAETKTGYKYKDPEGKTYCISFGIHFLDKKNGKDMYTDEECAAVLTHELGHAMQQAVCSINQNLAAVYIHAVFEDVYTCLNPIVGILTLGLAPLASIWMHKQYKDLKAEDPEYLGDEIIKQGIGSNKGEYDRDRFGKYIDNNTEAEIKKLPTKKSNPVGNFFIKFLSFTIGGLFTIVGDIISGIINIPQNLYVLSQSGFLSKNRRFEQFADIYTAAYGLGPAQASALAKIGNDFGYKQDYGIFSLLNYVPVINLITGVSHYMNSSIRQLAAGYPDTTGRMAAIYKSLDAELKANKDLSPEDKKAIEEEISTMNEIYNEYVYDWSPKGFVFALWHKVTFKNLKNTKSDAATNVLDALSDMEKESKFKNANKTNTDKKDVDLDSNKLVSIMFKTIKNLKTKYGDSTKNIIGTVEPELRKI